MLLGRIGAMVKEWLLRISDVECVQAIDGNSSSRVGCKLELGLRN